jgi:hypothetical protein
MASVLGLSLLSTIELHNSSQAARRTKRNESGEALTPPLKKATLALTHSAAICRFPAL